MFDFNQDKKKEYNWTVNQKAVIEAAHQNGSPDVIAVQAYAGTGKSTVLSEIAHQYPEGLYLAFNKEVVKDMLPKLPFGWECKTFNAMGLRLVKEAGLNPKVNFKKFRNMLSKAREHKLLDYLLMHCGGNSYTRLFEACNHVGIDSGEYHSKKSKVSLAKRFQKVLKNKTQISGNEMLWWPISMNLTTRKKYPILLIDEAVDMNELQLEFIRRIRTDRIVFMYDKWQNIYGFNGAVPDLEEWLLKYDVKFMTLPHSFRCPERVINEVRHFHTGIRSAKPGGTVRSVDVPSLVIPDSCLIIARFNADLLTAANILLKTDRKFTIKKRMLMKLIHLLQELKKDTPDIQEVTRYLLRSLEQYRNYAGRQTTLSMTEDINMHEGSMQLLKMGGLTWDGVDKVCTKMLAMSSEDHLIKLATIHAAKGLEHDHVIFMGQNRMHKLMAFDNINHVQEKNLMYVAVTRSKERLIYVNV